PLHKPTPDVSTHIKPVLPWNFSIVRIKDKANKNILETGNNNNQTCFTNIDNKFPLESGWALKNNQKYGQRGSRKRITSTVRAYLKGFFLAGNLNKTDRMSAKDMITELKKLVEEGEIQKNEVPEIKTVESWITRYSASLRKELAELRVIDKTNKRPKKNHSSKYSCKWQKK
ncbi:18404_t:CDS:2, partial [Gigaspora margarita]